ncbi:MAG: hypothetical protein ABSE62_14180 [Chthoniobacteraceae bacterium]|jgi:hypothetical protein
MTSPIKPYRDSVFINCPFDEEYAPIFRAIVFTVSLCGFVPRSTLEHDDASQVRIEKIYRLIGASPLGIHDVSRTELDAENQLPRFNMPLELGVFLGAKRFGTGQHRSKRCLILDRDRYRFQKFISDIAGQDIKSHGNSPETAIRVVRDWLRNAVDHAKMPGGSHLWAKYRQFTEDLTGMCEKGQLTPEHLTFTDFYQLVLEWISPAR